MSIFDDLFEVIPSMPDRHATNDPVWRIWKAAAAPAVEAAFGNRGLDQGFGPFGNVSMPYFKMGKIDSLDLFGMDELIIFAFYRSNRHRYKRVVDFGANIGLHSIIMSRCGFDVRSFEPDPIHLERLRKNLHLNNVCAEVRDVAVALTDGEAEFVRVLGNTTGSHLKGAKSDPYGGTEVLKVRVEDARPHLHWADLAKIDIEGLEAELLTGLPHETWSDTDAIVEVGTKENANRILDHFRGSPVRLFAQKIGWRPVAKLEDMPFSHRDGSLFISTKASMSWAA
jgi:FkbM family methyltransferase